MFTVSHIYNFIFLPFTFTTFAPNSTPIVISCYNLILFSTNCKTKHDLPTPLFKTIIYFGIYFINSIKLPVSPITINLNKYV